MRELKFRAWANGYEKWCHHIEYMGDGLWLGYVDDGVGELSTTDIIVEQYTGLKDKNGKEIYEGDVLGGDWLECYIAWCNKCKQFQVFTAFGCMACSGDVHWFEIVEDDGKLDVIGNIHENSELIKEEE